MKYTAIQPASVSEGSSTVEIHVDESAVDNLPTIPMDVDRRQFATETDDSDAPAATATAVRCGSLVSTLMILGTGQYADLGPIQMITPMRAK